MATILDSLMVELGLDSSKFMANQKKVIDALKEIQAENEKLSKSGNDLTEKTTAVNKKSADQDKKTNTEKKKAVQEDKKAGEESTKRAKQTQLDNKNIAESISKATIAAAAFATSFVGIKQISDFSTNLSLANASLGRTSALVSQSPQELQAWSKVFEAGGDAAGAYSNTLGQLLSRISQIKTGDSLLSELASARIQPSFMEPFSTDPSKLFNLLKLSEELKRLEKTEGRIYAQSVAERILGVTKEQYLVLIKSTEELQKAHDISLSKVAVDEDATKKAEETQKQITALDQALLKVGQNVQESLGPKMSFFRNLLIGVADSFSSLDDTSQNFITTLGSSSILLSTLAGLVGLAGIAFPALLPVAGGLAIAAIGGIAGSAGVWAHGSSSKEGLSAQSLMEYYISKGLDKEHAAALVGNAMQESSLNTHAPSTYKGKQYQGLFQLSPDRQNEYKAKHGKEYKDSTWQEMASYSLEEMDTTEKKASARFKAAKKVAEAAEYFSNDVQRPNSEAAANDKRSAYATQAFNSYVDPQINSTTSNTKNNSSSVQTGDIHIHTKATESAGIGESLMSNLGNLITTSSWAAGTY